MRKNLLSWQWSLYPDNHRDRANLALHLASAPLFPLGCLALLSAPWTGWWALGGALGMVAALVLQGRGHKREKVAPIPFEGPLDFVSRFLVEQWENFPRFVLSGGWSRAWRQAGR